MPAGFCALPGWITVALFHVNVLCERSCWWFCCWNLEKSSSQSCALQLPLLCNELLKLQHLAPKGRFSSIRCHTVWPALHGTGCRCTFVSVSQRSDWHSVELPAGFQAINMEIWAWEPSSCLAAFCLLHSLVKYHFSINRLIANSEIGVFTTDYLLQHDHPFKTFKDREIKRFLICTKALSLCL